MNRKIKTFELPLDENQNASEPRLKLSTLSFQFLAVTVCGATASISFLEREGGNAANQSFFIYKGEQVVRCPERNEHLASFVVEGQIYHLFGPKTLAS